MKPLIGITCNYDPRDEIGTISQMGQPGQQWMFLARDYITAVEMAGGTPVILPVCGQADTVLELAERMDGILISGGNDIDPRYYGSRGKAYCGRLRPERDRQETSLARYILQMTDKSVFGICRGMQILNVAAGGTLYQDTEREAGFEHHFLDMYPGECISHEVTVKEGSRLRQISGKKRLGVNSFHHQAVKTTGRGFTITAVSDDGVTEALEYAGERFALGVQWHPEMMKNSEAQQKIFRACVGACKRGREE